MKRRLSDAELVRYSLAAIGPEARRATIEALEAETASGQRLTPREIIAIAERHGARPHVVLAGCGYQPMLRKRGYVDLLAPPSEEPCYLVRGDTEWNCAAYLFRVFSGTRATMMRHS